MVKNFVNNIGELPIHLVASIQAGPVSITIGEVGYHNKKHWDLNSEDLRQNMEIQKTRGYEKLQEIALKSGYNGLFSINVLLKGITALNDYDHKWNSQIITEVEGLAYKLNLSRTE